VAFFLAQGGASLYKVDVASGARTALTLPTGITLSTTRKPRFALLNEWVMMTNSPTRNLLIDAEGAMLVLPKAPTHPPSVVAGASTGLTGAYTYWTSFKVKDREGRVLLESPLSPPSASVTLANQNASLSDIELPSSGADSYFERTFGARGVYRSLAGGSVPFHLFDIDDVSSRAALDNAPDATLELLPADTDVLVSPPGTTPGVRLQALTEWKSRLWAVSNEDPDTILISETNKVYAWPNSVVAYPKGQDSLGVIAFAKRRNQLGFLKRNGVWMVNATSGNTGIAVDNLSVKQISWENTGCIAEDSVVTIGDTVYWLGRDGVYEWTDDGVHSISKDLTHPWFTSDTYFNRTRFQYAFGRYNEITNSYELHLAGVGDSTETRWVSFNLTNRKWYGPHKTGALTPTHAAHLVDANGLPVTLVGGSDGVIYTGNSSNKRDGAATAIDMDCYGPWHHGGDPDKTHTWLQLSVLSKIESAGTMDVIPYVGGLDASAGTTITHTLTTGRELLSRLGVGRLARLRFRKNTVNQSATIYGYELPWITNGRR
jgi:hypothetical protein